MALNINTINCIITSINLIDSRLREGFIDRLIPYIKGLIEYLQCSVLLALVSSVFSELHWRPPIEIPTIITGRVDDVPPLLAQKQWTGLPTLFNLYFSPRQLDGLQRGLGARGLAQLHFIPRDYCLRVGVHTGQREWRC
jgi:hypothetical protein